MPTRILRAAGDVLLGLSLREFLEIAGRKAGREARLTATLCRSFWIGSKRLKSSHVEDNQLLILAGILVVGISSQWFAWRLRLPSILLLLAAGITAGASGVLDPEALLGEDLLSAIVSLSVGVILYEGGLTLKFQELKTTGRIVTRLVTVGAFVTWGVATLLAHYVLGIDWQIALLLGSVLIVTGPTVIQPLLRIVRPTGPVGGILKWEGIVIDPVGALTALLVFEAIGSSEVHILTAIAKTLLIGGGLGLMGAAVFVVMLKRYLIPDFLMSAVSLALCLGVFAASNSAQHESGLFAVTLMGVLLANQRFVDVEEIIEFKENLRVLLLSGLFVVLGARLQLEDVLDLGWRGVAFVALLILIARPLSVFFSTVGSKLPRREVLFLSWMAPRGIVAAAVASIFALGLERKGIEGAEVLVSATFAVIIGTVVVYGFTAPIVAYRLGLAEKDPRGILLIGASSWHRAMAEALQKLDVRVLMIDTNHENTRLARMAGLESFTGSAVGEHILDRIDLGGLGCILCATPNDWINLVASQRIGRYFDREHTYQLAPRTSLPAKDAAHDRLGGRIFASREADYGYLQGRISAGSVFKSTKISEEFNMDDFYELYGEEALPLFLQTADGKLRIFTDDSEHEPQAGDKLVALVHEES